MACNHLSRFLIPVSALWLSATSVSLAAEGGAGFYLLGSKTELAGIAPPPGRYAQLDLYSYSGSANADRSIPIGGRVSLGLDADVVLGLATGIWSFDKGPILGGQPFAAFTVPFGYKSISSDVTLATSGGAVISRNAEEDDFTVGDPVAAFGLGWGSGPWFGSTTVSVNIPVGDYDADRTTNISFNRWALDITSGLTWLDMKSGWQSSLAMGLTFNGENDETDYTTGTEFHLEGSVTRTFSNGWTVGVHGYHYNQITGDSGPGAVLGDFEGRVSALGLGVSYQPKINNTPVTLKARWFKEFDAINRVEGDALYLSASFPF
jgi:hypothetical protein